MAAALVLHGPNLNLLGTREPGIYGRTTLGAVDRLIKEHARKRGVRVECRQSNHEGQLVDWLQAARREGFVGVVFNPGAFTEVKKNKNAVRAKVYADALEKLRKIAGTLPCPAPAHAFRRGTSFSPRLHLRWSDPVPPEPTPASPSERRSA